jgi:hypothetical protein
MDDARLHAELRRYWDEVARGEPANPEGLDLDLLQMIRQLHALGDEPLPDPVYAARLRESLMHAIALPLPLAGPLARPSLNGRSTPVARPAIRPWPVPQRPWALTQLATAALIVLVLVSSFIAFGPGRPDRNAEAPALIPAVSGTPATPGTVNTDTLIETEVAALPGGRLRVAVDRWTLQPSPSAVTLPAHEGMVVLTVDVGQLTVTVEGTDHQLAGRAALEVTNEEFALHNPGSTEAIAYVVYAIPQFSAEVGHGADQIWLSGDPLVHTHDVVISTVAETFPAGSGHLVLQRVTLPPGSALPPEAANPWVWTRAEAGVLGLTLEGGHLPLGWDSGTEREFPPFFQNLLPAVAPGTLMVMRNAGDDPLVLYRLTLAPSGVGELSS